MRAPARIIALIALDGRLLGDRFRFRLGLGLGRRGSINALDGGVDRGQAIGDDLKLLGGDVGKVGVDERLHLCLKFSDLGGCCRKAGGNAVGGGLRLGTDMVDCCLKVRECCHEALLSVKDSVDSDESAKPADMIPMVVALRHDLLSPSCGAGTRAPCMPAR